MLYAGILLKNVPMTVDFLVAGSKTLTNNQVTCTVYRNLGMDGQNVVIGIREYTVDTIPLLSSGFSSSEPSTGGVAALSSCIAGTVLSRNFDVTVKVTPNAPFTLSGGLQEYKMQVKLDELYQLVATITPL